MKQLKKKIIASSAILGFLLGSTAPALADSVSTNDHNSKSESPVIGKLLIRTPRMNVAMTGGGAPRNHSLTFIEYSGPGILYYDNTEGKYIWVQTESASTYTINTIINGWAGNLGGDHFKAYREP